MDKDCSVDISDAMRPCSEDLQQFPGIFCVFKMQHLEKHNGAPSNKPMPRLIYS
jgi:hypothetical protein